MAVAFTDIRKGVLKLVCGLILNAMLALPAASTVLEYDNEGAVSVSESKAANAAYTPQSANTDSTNKTRLKELARTVAVRFSGEPGVRKAGLDALTFIEVFEALIVAESNFNPNAISAKGAQGLGQLMPGTASDMKVADPFDPHQNLVGSARYLTGLLAEFGRLELALAAYNAGPERVKQHSGVPPFAETKSYIAKILRQSGLVGKSKTPSAAKPVSAPINKEQPLNGDVSVWEF